MKISRKLRNTILNAIRDAGYAALDYHCEDFIQNHPDMWDQFQTERFDLISDVEYRIEQAVKEIIGHED